MEKSLIIERFNKTIDRLKTLDNSQFDWSTFVREFDSENGCGTVCCVAGWYPKWFPETNLVYDEDGILISTQHRSNNRQENIDLSLMEYHGVNINILDIIFYGFSIVVKRSELFDDSRWVYDDYEGAYRTSINMDEYTPSDLIKLIRFIIVLIETDQINYQLE